ncbi:MAG: 1,4-alpha-glucan branching enzyme [Epulopiscium sp. Nuni2H_MBin003]|nr:MAG: 1,4-alpha-glucan branching enzyme [Epulopiscium sp. Nuni2H_MBin003]
MNKLTNSCIFSLFIPAVTENDLYQYEIKTLGDELLYKADPFANHFGDKPKKHSLPYEQQKYIWKDGDYLANLEGKNNRNQPISIYEVHIGSWKFNEDRHLTYKELANELVDYVKYLNYTHVEFIGVLEHPFDGSWGYQVTGFFAPTSRYGTPDEFKYLVDTFHQNGIGVILDWVPGHFPKDAFALEVFDGTKIYEIEGEHPEWGTLLFNYHKREVKNFLLSSAIMWLEQFHVDGLRVDAVASMLYGGNLGGGVADLSASTFLKELNGIITARYPHKLVIAEDSSTWDGVTRDTKDGGLGFDFKWDLGFMHDTLNFMKTEYDYRGASLSKLTFSLDYMYNEHYLLPLSHDEVVHCKSPLLYKMCGDWWQKFANIRTLYGFMYTHPGKKLLFMGGEFGQTEEWIEENQLMWELLQYPEHNGLQTYVKDLNEFYRNNPALYMEENIGLNFEWINGDNVDSLVVSFIRRTAEQELIIVVNFSLRPHMDYYVGVSKAGVYKEVFNSDSKKYIGSGVVNLVEVSSVNENCQYKDNYIKINVPPLGVTIFEKIK